MKYLFINLLFFVYQFSFAQGSTIILEVEGIVLKKGGELSAGIFKQETFPKVGKQFIGQELNITNNSMRVVFPNIPAGVYAVAVYQDIDRNKDLKTNFIGFPLEPIGFSNDARIKLGPPSFNVAMFTISTGETRILKIILH